MDALGIRSNNPGNIRAGSVKWHGQVGVNIHGFVVFDTPRNGLRALAKLLLTYYDKHGLKTVRGIVTRWAPPVENNTPAYIASVALHIDRGADEVLDLHDPDTLDDLVHAIVLHENGYFPYTARDLVTAANDALGVA